MLTVNGVTNSMELRIEMNFRIIEQAIYIDESHQVLEVFTSDPISDSKTPIDKLVSFVIERYNKLYSDYYLSIDKDGDYSIREHGPDGQIIFLADCPRAFLSRVEYLRF